MAEPVTFRTFKREFAECLACGEKIPARSDGMFQVSPHLRDFHGLTGEIFFETISEVICPPMLVVRASERAAPAEEKHG